MHFSPRRRTTVCGGRVMSLMTAACACCTAAAAAGWSLLTMWICLAAFLGCSGTATNDFLLMLFMVSSDASLSDSSSSESVEKRLVGKRMVPTLVLPGEEEEEDPSNWGMRSEELQDEDLNFYEMLLRSEYKGAVQCSLDGLNRYSLCFKMHSPDVKPQNVHLLTPCFRRSCSRRRRRCR